MVYYGEKKYSRQKMMQPEHEPRIRPLTGKVDCIYDQQASDCCNCAGPEQVSSVCYKVGFDLGRAKVEKRSLCSIARRKTAIRRNTNCSF